MRKLPVLFCLLLLLCVPTAAAIAQEPPSRGDGGPDNSGNVDSNGVVTLLAGLPGVAGTETTVTVDFDSSGNPIVQVDTAWVTVPAVVQAPDPLQDPPPFRGACETTRVLAVPAGTEDATLAATVAALQRSLQALFPGEGITLDDIPPCVGVPPVTDDDIVDGYAAMVDRVIRQLPRPTPRVTPATAVTGLDAYLETDRELTPPVAPDTLQLGPTTLPVTIDAVGTFTVDWGQADDGDGPAFERTTGPHTTPGRPYVDGQPLDAEAITHVYTSTPAGPLTVSVTDTWRLTYTVQVPEPDGTITTRTGTLVAELAPMTTTVDVTEYQAIIRN